MLRRPVKPRLKANAMELMCLKSLLYTFEISTGLKVNFNKSSMMPINMDEDRLSHLTRTVNCQKGSLPFTYLGLPLGITKPSLDYFIPIVTRVEKRLCGITDFLNYGGKLQMVKSVMTSLPIFFMCTLDVPHSIKEQVVKYKFAVV